MEYIGSFLRKDVLTWYGRKIFIKTFGFSYEAFSLGGSNLYILNMQ